MCEENFTKILFHPLFLLYEVYPTVQTLLCFCARTEMEENSVANFYCKYRTDNQALTSVCLVVCIYYQAVLAALI